MNQYIVPANSKKSRLILGWFVITDIIVLAIGFGLSIILWVIINATKDSSLLKLLLGCIPLLLALGSVMLIPNYHNVRQFLTNVIMFFTNRRKYYWKGWCVKDEE